MRGNSRAAALALALWSAATVASAADEPPGDVKTGLKLSLEKCTECHVVAKAQPTPPKIPAVSFTAVADRASVTTETLTKFLQTTHRTIEEPYNMPNPNLSPKETADIVAYILSLAQGP
jgi:mono/diheme cytochrome c family protein